MKFKAKLDIIGINPFVFVPERILREIFKQAGKDKGPIPVKGTINGKKYKQTLVKYRGEWRFYVNTIMLADSPKRVGEKVEITIEFDPSDRTIKPHPALTKALNANANARKEFDRLPPSRQKEIVRYISYLKTEESVNRAVKKALGYLTGRNRFAGRDKTAVTSRRFT